MNNWITVTNFNHTKNGFGDNYFIRNNEDGTQTYFKDDLSQFSDNEVKTLLENDIPNNFTDNLNTQSGTGIQHGGVKTGYLTMQGFNQAVANLDADLEAKDEIRIIQGSFIYNQYNWSYTTGTKGVDLITRYLYNLSLPYMFKKNMFENDPIWGPEYDVNIKMKTFDAKANINNIINLYFKIPDNKKVLKIQDNPDNRQILFDILSDRLITSSQKKQTKLMYLLQKNVSCINTFCPRIALQGPQPNSIKMRQECKPCKKRDDDNSIIDGLGVRVLNDGTTEIDDENVVFVCPRYCVNSKYKIDTKTWTKTGTNPTPITYSNKYNLNDTGPLKDKNGNPFFCPINWKKYKILVTGVFEIDHINGNHWDNSKDNVQSLCKLCHETKSILSGDKKNTEVPGAPISITVLLQKEIDDIENDDKKLNEEVLKRVNKYRQFCLNNDLDSNEVFTVPIDYDAELKNIDDLYAAYNPPNSTSIKEIPIKDIKDIIKR